MRIYSSLFWFKVEEISWQNRTNLISSHHWVISVFQFSSLFQAKRKGFFCAGILDGRVRTYSSLFWPFPFNYIESVWFNFYFVWLDAVNDDYDEANNTIIQHLIWDIYCWLMSKISASESASDFFNFYFCSYFMVSELGFDFGL